MSDRSLRRLRRKYGPEFPDPEIVFDKDVDPKVAGLAWRQWLNSVIEQQRGVMQEKRLHWARHRLFRQGRQWISTRDGKTWKEAGASSNRIRAVFNEIGPALDFRSSLLQEQRPGFQHEPIPGGGVDGRESAMAQQSVVEYYFNTQKIWRLMLEAGVNAQTDGVCWLNVYIDKRAGPTLENVRLLDREDERYKGLEAQGYEVRDDGLLIVPITDAGQVGGPGEKIMSRSGDMRTRIILAHETLSDPQSRTIVGPDAEAKWFLIRKVRDLRTARIMLNLPELEAETTAINADPLDVSTGDINVYWDKGLPPFPSTRVRTELGVFDDILYIAPDGEDFQEGAWINVVSDRLIDTKRSLPGQRIPIARITDGSTDPELYPRPVMSDWTGDQTSINALGSKILEISRLHSGSRLLALKDSVIQETWTNIMGSVIEYRGPKPTELPPSRVNPDLWSAFQMLIRKLEDKTGWNDLARGQVAADSGSFQDVSGRAVLGARELFERQFGPMIRATAQGASDWAELTVVYAKHLFKTPRLIPIAGRPDLAKRISSETLGDQPVVFVDPQTLMPLPRSLRNQMLLDHLKEGLITVQEYRKRAPFAEIRDLQMGDVDQWNRAQWVNTVIEENWEDLAKMDAVELYGSTSGLAVWWQDEAEVHMRALDEIILDPKKPFAMRKIAADRWGIYQDVLKTQSFPIELELQGFARPPAPIEVLGVPNSVAQATEPSEQQTIDDPSGVLPAQGVAPAPEISGPAPPKASVDAAQPLGSLGAIEQALGQ